MQSLSTAYPVSASAQYLDERGEVIDEREYEVLKSFSFEKTVAAPAHERSEVALSLESELNRYVAQSRGTAVANLRVEAISYDASSHQDAAFLKRSGWLFGFFGGAVVAGGVATKDEATKVVMLSAGGVMLGLAGFAVAGLYTFADRPVTWKFKVQGDVVRGRSAESLVPSPVVPPHPESTVPVTPSPPTNDAPAPQSEPAAP